MLLPAFAVRAFCNLLIRYQDESPDIGAFADALTMNIDDVDEAIRQRRTAVRVALSAAHSAVFEPLTYHSTPLPYTNPACRAALTCTTNANVVKAARRQSEFTWVLGMSNSKVNPVLASDFVHFSAR